LSARGLENIAYKEANKDEISQIWGGLLFTFWLGRFGKILTCLLPHKVEIECASGESAVRDAEEFQQFIASKIIFEFASGNSEVIDIKKLLRFDCMPIISLKIHRVDIFQRQTGHN
jgi:hypothetical protein